MATHTPSGDLIGDDLEDLVARPAPVRHLDADVVARHGLFDLRVVDLHGLDDVFEIRCVADVFEGVPHLHLTGRDLDRRDAGLREEFYDFADFLLRHNDHPPFFQIPTTAVV